MATTTLRAACTLFALAPLASAADLVDFGGVDFRRDQPKVRFDLPNAVLVREATDAGVGRLVTVELPVSVLVSRGDVDRVQEIVVAVDGAAAGLTVHDYAPTTRLETEFSGDIEQQSTSENERHFDASLGGRLALGGAVAQITPGVGVARTNQETATEKRARLAPKRAVVVASPINGRRGVLFKFRPYSQTTLEGEHHLRLTFTAPSGWNGGELNVKCQATGRRKALFTEKPTTWSQKMAPVALRLAESPAAAISEQLTSAQAKGEQATGGQPVRHTAAKPMLDDSPSTSGPTASGPTMWKPRKRVKPVAEFSR